MAIHQTEADEETIVICAYCNMHEPKCDGCGKEFECGDTLLCDTYDHYHYCTMVCRKKHFKKSKEEKEGKDE